MSLNEGLIEIGFGKKIWLGLNPNRSLAAGVIWLVVSLAVAFSVAATVWVGSIARESVIAQHQRRMSLETDQLSSAVSQAVAERLSAIRVTEALIRKAGAQQEKEMLREVFAELTTAYPQLDWIAIAAIDGTLIDDVSDIRTGKASSSQAWVSGGFKGPWIGVVDEGGKSATAAASRKAFLGDMAAPLHDAYGRVIAVVCAKLSWRRTENHPQRLTDEIDGFGNANAYLLDGDGVVLVGPSDLLGKQWTGTRAHNTSTLEDSPVGAHWENLPTGGEVLVAREMVGLAPEYSSLIWFVQLSESRHLAYQRADSLALRILWASSLLAGITISIGVIGARQITRRLRRLTESVTAAGDSDSGNLEVPTGGDEVAHLGAAFAHILGELHRERRELERRVALRTREVERLAEDARYTAIVRERLKMGRDLHDTLAHSMMAILSQIRYLRRLQSHDPHAVAAELARAEEIAHEGLKETRSAIAQMRVSTVRETGLGEALSREVERLVVRTGITAELSIDPVAARFADDRAETLLRIAQEAVRNIERHSMATKMALELKLMDERQLTLQIEDNGVGFDVSVETPGHYGIVGLREQADLIGARLVIESKPRKGTVLTVFMGLSPERFGDAAGSTQGHRV